MCRAHDLLALMPRRGALVFAFPLGEHVVLTREVVDLVVVLPPAPAPQARVAHCWRLAEEY